MTAVMTKCQKYAYLSYNSVSEIEQLNFLSSDYLHRLAIIEGSAQSNCFIHEVSFLHKYTLQNIIS